jgi:uncharacterized OsmC-like protein
MDVRELQKPLKARYREEPTEAQITLSATADGSQPIECSVAVGRAVHAAQAHAGVGGEGVAPCSGDLLLGALAACAQITCQMVAAATGVEATISTHVEGDLDLRGTLGIDREVAVGFTAIRVRIEIDAPNATAEELASLEERTQRYCVVLQTLVTPPEISFSAGSGTTT